MKREGVLAHLPSPTSRVPALQRPRCGSYFPALTRAAFQGDPSRAPALSVDPRRGAGPQVGSEPGTSRVLAAASPWSSHP